MAGGACAEPAAGNAEVEPPGFTVQGSELSRAAEIDEAITSSRGRGFRGLPREQRRAPAGELLVVRVDPERLFQ